MNARALAVIVAFVAASRVDLTIASHPNEERIKNLESVLIPMIESHRGEVSVAIKDLDSGAAFSFREQSTMPTASLIKLPILVELYRQADAGSVDLDAKIELSSDDLVPGSGILSQHFSPGMQLSLRDAARLMIAFSDNTASNLVIDQIGLPATSRTMKEMGFPETQLHSKVYRGETSIAPRRSKAYGLGSTRAADVIAILEKIYRRELVSPEASTEMLEHLFACDDDDRLARDLPDSLRFAHKSGAVSASRCDAGLLITPGGPIAICVLTTNNEDKGWGSDNEADSLLARIGAEAASHFTPAKDSDSGQKQASLKLGDFGEMVEALQRTLNDRLRPSPSLSVDGDFGPMTRSAVIDFQRQSKLDENGVVDTKTWQALSPLMLDALPVQSPEVINAEVLPLLGADDAAGPPWVTCKAWGISNPISGEIIGGGHLEKPLPIASTTKIMTAFLVLQIAESQPDVLEETMTFSARADQTRGSTSGIREGESTSVRECLYGLMLPSGNDAAVALAEHFGERIHGSGGSDSDAQPADPLALFVRAMNRQAKQMSLNETIFQNPNGLHHEEHHSSVRDLLALATAAIKSPLFREIVATRQRGCTVTGIGGYRRNIHWKNTNVLLGTTGYLGIKTGTTGPAGACLVALANHGDQERLLVLLGATSSTARYVDARNLFRWSWASD